MEAREKKLFVVKAFHIDGKYYPIGIELATSLLKAMKQAREKWPNYQTLSVHQWADVPPEVRLQAIEYDRQMPVEFNLHVGVLL